MNPNPIFRNLNEPQKAAVAALRGPVCILAGAGSGKTTTVTRRIAHQVTSGAFTPSQILAVTFTDKAAKEMAGRLKTLGVPTVRARTFHSEALAQFRQFSTEPTEIIAAKVQILRSLVQALPPPYKFTSARDYATEIEWAKNRRIKPHRYLDLLGDHEPPVPAEVAASIYASYETRKSRAKMMDFEDLLERTVELLHADPDAAYQVQSRYMAFTVDEYQDVNLLQQSLLDAWLGARDDICVVGDDYQSIFGFTGADPAYLLQFSKRFPSCASIALTDNYRSTPEILAMANRLEPRLVGSSKVLRPTRISGATPVAKQFDEGAEEAKWIADTARDLHSRGVRWEEMAILYRINGRSEDFEDALAKASVPFQVADSPFLRRPAARAVLNKLKALRTAEVAGAVASAVRQLGYRPDEEFTGDEATRQADLARLLAMGAEYSGGGGATGFIADLTSRFSREENGRGVQLLTYHRAKGKEFEVVFLPRLEDKELPFALAKSAERLVDERRLFYVGITRAKDHLFLTWAMRRELERASRKTPSVFLQEVGVGRPSTNGSRKPVGQAPSTPLKGSGIQADLRKWRLETARESGVPAYVVFQDSTLLGIAEALPSTLDQLRTIKGMGPGRVESYGLAILAVIAASSGQA